jgi:hypothetical protein
MWSLAAIAWVRESIARNGSVRYRIAPTVCDLPLREADGLFSWRPRGCDAVRSTVRIAFGEWARNCDLIAAEREEGVVDVVVSAARMPAGARVAHVRRDSPLRLEVGSNRCWYLERELCHASAVIADLWLWPVLGIVWLLALGAALWTRTRAAVPVAPVAVAASCAASAAVAGGPLLVALLWPCGRCHDLRRTLLHEVGHALGLGHSDDASLSGHVGGCGAAAADGVALSPGADSLMRERLARAPRACLAVDDADAVRTLYGGNCSASVACDDVGGDGLAAVGVAAAYALALALAFEALWACARGGTVPPAHHLRTPAKTAAHAVAMTVAPAATAASEGCGVRMERRSDRTMSRTLIASFSDSSVHVPSGLQAISFT